MKKVVVVWVLVLVIGSKFQANAQLSVGPKAGLQVSKILYFDKDNKDLYQSKPLIGFNAGVAANLKVKDNFDLYGEVIFAQKGKHITGKIDSRLKHKATYNYIEIPILFRVSFKGTIKKSNDFIWYINTGPNVSYWLNGKGRLETSELYLENDIDYLDYTLTFNEISTNENTVNILEPNRFQFGLLFGGGFILNPNAKEIIIVDARLELGNTFLAKDEEVEWPVILFDYNDDLRAVNAGLRFSVAYLFDVGFGQAKKGKSNIDKKKK